MLRELLAAGALAACLSIAATPTPARACSVCLPGDPLFSNHGTSAQSEGNLSLNLQAKGWRKEAAHLPHGDEDDDHDHAPGGHADAPGLERNESERVDLYLSWTPVDRLTLTLDVPWAFNEIEDLEDGSTHSLSGLGDVSLQASWVAWRSRDVLPDTWLELRALLKAPTGRHDRDRDGEVDPHLQPGTGSWDVGLGVAAVHRFEKGSVYASLMHRWNDEGRFDGLDYQYGDVLLANLALEVPLGHAFGAPALEGLTLGGELNFRWADFDRVNGERFRDSGGTIVYVTPSLRWRLPIDIGPRPLSLRLAVQVPLSSSSLHGRQDEDPIWTVGLFVPL